jgi:hypothetical protein
MMNMNGGLILSLGMYIWYIRSYLNLALSLINNVVILRSHVYLSIVLWAAYLPWA